MIEPDRTALLVVCPEVEPVVRHHRRRYDAAARVGVPAHVTVLYPFVAPAEVTRVVRERAAAVAAAAAPFDLVLRRTAWFDETVLYLAPEDSDPLVALTAAVTAAFSGNPPYENRHPGTVPHLTVARDQPYPVLREVEKAVLPVLPVHQHVAALELWTGPRPTTHGEARWRRLETFPFGDPGAPGSGRRSQRHGRPTHRESST